MRLRRVRYSGSLSANWLALFVTQIEHHLNYIESVLERTLAFSLLGRCNWTIDAVTWQESYLGGPKHTMILTVNITATKGDLWKSKIVSNGFVIRW